MSSHVNLRVRRTDPNPARLDALLRSGHLVAPFRGIYVPSTADSPEREWLTLLHATIVRAGDGAGASHRSAARLHPLDGFDSDIDRHLDVIAPMSCTLRPPTVVRSRTLRLDDLVMLDGMRVTSVERTLLDLGTKVDRQTLEIALESGLRGPDPGRPDVWDEGLLARLELRCEARGQGTGIPALRSVLAGRGRGTRPTGSIAETWAMQALRRGGFDPYRQARIRIGDRSGHRTFWADLADLDRGLVIEVDGLEFHGSAAAQQRASSAERHQRGVDRAQVLCRRSSPSS